MNILGGNLIKRVFVKKIVLLFILMMGFLNAKQFAYCESTSVGNPESITCFSVKANSVENMYKKGWRLISVNTVYVRYNSTYHTYFYFEK